LNDTSPPAVADASPSADDDFDPCDFNAPERNYDIPENEFPALWR
jgi:hypothetical protein